MNEVTQQKVNEYVMGAIRYPLVKGQLESMVILHFDIPDEQAKTMVNIALDILRTQVIKNVL